LIFTLRRVDAKDLVTQAGAGLPQSRQGPTAGKTLDDALLADVFGIEMADVAPPTRPATPRHKSTATRVATTTTREAPKARKSEPTEKTVAAQKPAKAKVPAKSSANPRKSATHKAKTTSTTRVPKRKASTTGHVPHRSVKEKSR
jgi:hypothetical protein